jgi:predicted CoA-binding protein
MARQGPVSDEVERLLVEASTIAVVGASSNPDRPSHGVFKALLARGYRVIPVNPNETAVLGQRAYASLEDVPEPIDIVDVFRRPEHTPRIADQAARVGAKALWLQLGIVNDEAARRAASRGLKVVMDNCLAVTLSVLGIGAKRAALAAAPQRAPFSGA